MPVETKTSIIYTCDDGKEFTSREQACDHQAYLDFRNIIDAAGIGRGGEWSREMVLNALWDRREDVYAALAQIVRC